MSIQLTNCNCKAFKKKERNQDRQRKNKKSNFQLSVSYQCVISILCKKLYPQAKYNIFVIEQVKQLAMDVDLTFLISVFVVQVKKFYEGHQSYYHILSDKANVRCPQVT